MISLYLRKLLRGRSMMVYSLFASLILAGCKIHEKNTDMPGGPYHAVFSVSPAAALLLDRLQSVFPEGYIPGKDEERATLVQSQGYTREKEGEYVVSGFIRTGGEFDRALLENKGIVLSPGNGPVYTVRIPLEQLPFFLHYSGIVYFDLSRKVFFR